MDHFLRIEYNVMHFYFHSVSGDENLDVDEIRFEFSSIPLYQIEKLKIEIQFIIHKLKQIHTLLL
jgi:hypothetical protein